MFRLLARWESFGQLHETPLAGYKQKGVLYCVVTMEEESKCHTSSTRFSQCDPVVPGPPWFSTSAPSSVGQLKYLRASSRTLGVTIM